MGSSPDRLLYNQTAKRLKAELVGREHTVIADVPYRRGHRTRRRGGPRRWPHDGDALIGGRRPLHGRKPADRRVRVERPHAAVLPLPRAGPARRQASRLAAADTRSAAVLARVRGRVVFGRPLSNYEEIDGAAPEEEGAGDLQLRPDQLVGLRDRGDPAGPRARRGGRTVPEPADRGRDRAAPGGRLRQLPTDRLRVPVGRRRVRRGEGQPRADLLRSSPPGALLVDYVMTVAVSTASAVEQITSAVPDALRQSGSRSASLRSPDHDRQPARPPRVGQHLRGPDVPVRRVLRSS